MRSVSHEIQDPHADPNRLALETLLRAYGRTGRTQLVLTSLAVQPYCAMFLHSAGTNDTKRLNWTSASFALALIANGVILLPAVVLFFSFNTSLRDVK